MQDLEPLTRRIEAIFTRIQEEQMAGIPLLNPLLRVQTLGFRHYRSRAVGILITPWMMNLMLFPAVDEDWSGCRPGAKRFHCFPANEYPFMDNEIEGLGHHRSHALYSPMHEFINQDHAVAAAENFLETLMTEVAEPDRDPHDEELLGRILRGEKCPEREMPESPADGGTAGAGKGRMATERGMTRREMLRGGRFGTEV